MSQSPSVQQHLPSPSQPPVTTHPPYFIAPQIISSHGSPPNAKGDKKNDSHHHSGGGTNYSSHLDIDTTSAFNPHLFGAYLTKHMHTSMKIQENILRWDSWQHQQQILKEKKMLLQNGMRNQDINADTNSSLEEQEKKLKSLHFQDCFDWHQIERDVMRYLIETKKQEDDQCTHLCEEIAAKEALRKKKLEKLNQLVQESQNLQHNHTIEKTQHRIDYMWRQVELDQKYLDKWWKEDIRQLEQNVQSQQQEYNDKVWEIQHAEDAFLEKMEELRVHYGLGRESRLQNALIQQEKEKKKIDFSHVEQQHTQVRDRFRKKSRKRRNLEFDVLCLRAECEALRNTLVYARIRDLGRFSEVIPKTIKDRKHDELSAEIKQLKEKYKDDRYKYFFRKRYIDETPDEFEEQRDLHKLRVEKMIPFREKQATESLSDYRESKAAYLKHYYLFRSQRPNELLSEYKEKKNKYFRLLLKKPFRGIKPDENPKLYEFEKKRYEEQIFHSFRPQYHDETDSEYFVARDLWYRRVHWLDFRERFDDEPESLYRDKRIEFYRTFLQFRKIYPLETREEYRKARDDYFLKFEEYRSTFMWDISDSDLQIEQPEEKQEDSPPQKKRKRKGGRKGKRRKHQHPKQTVADPTSTETPPLESSLISKYIQLQEQLGGYNHAGKTILSSDEHAVLPMHALRSDDFVEFLEGVRDETTLSSTQQSSSLNLPNINGNATQRRHSMNSAHDILYAESESPNGPRPTNIEELRKTLRKDVKQKLDRELRFLRYRFSEYDESRLNMFAGYATGDAAGDKGDSPSKNSRKVTSNFSRYVGKTTKWNPRGKLRRYMRVLLQVIQKRSRSRAQMNAPVWLTTEQLVLEAFKTLDVDRDGSLTHREFKKIFRVLGHNLSTKDIKKMLRDADEDGNGEISYNEFMDLLLEDERNDIGDRMRRRAFR